MMDKKSPQFINKLRRLAQVVDNGDVAILDYLIELEDKFEQLKNTVEPNISNMLEQVKGKDGQDGEQGERGFTGAQGKDGRNGVDGKNGRDGQDGRDGRDGQDGRDGIDGEDGKDGSPDTAEQIVDKINSLPTDDDNFKIGKEHISGLDDEFSKIKSSLVGISGRGFIGGGGGGSVSKIIAGTNVTISPTTGVGNVTINATGGSGTGWTVSTPSGALYDQDTQTGGTSFTSVGTATVVWADGATYFDGAGCTISGTSITMDVPVTSYIRVGV